MPSFLSLFAKKSERENPRLWFWESSEWVLLPLNQIIHHSLWFWVSDTKMVNPRIPRSRIPTFTLFTSAISIVLCIFFVLSFLFTAHSYSSHQHHNAVSLYFYLIFNLFYVFSLLWFFPENKKTFIFCNFLISGFLIYWVSLIRRKIWWDGFRFGSYCVGSNASDLILSWSSEGLIRAYFHGNVTRNGKRLCFLFWESTEIWLSQVINLFLCFGTRIDLF